MEGPNNAIKPTQVKLGKSVQGVFDKDLKSQRHSDCRAHRHMFSQEALTAKETHSSRDPLTAARRTGVQNTKAHRIRMLEIHRGAPYIYVYVYVCIYIYIYGTIYRVLGFSRHYVQKLRGEQSSVFSGKKRTFRNRRKHIREYWKAFSRILRAHHHAFLRAN